MTPEAWKEQAAHTVSESGAASDWEHALKIGADLYPLVQQAIAAERERCAKVAEGWETEAAGDEYMTCGNGKFWDAGTAYDQGRADSAASIRARGD